MRRFLAGPVLVLPLAAIALPLAPSARAATTPPGVNIRWDHCYDDGGTLNKTFACDTNSGSERLVVSFVLAEPLANVNGTEIAIEVMASGATLPSWWQYRNFGACRQTALAITEALPSGSTNCTDWANGLASMNIAGCLLDR